VSLSFPLTVSLLRDPSPDPYPFGIDEAFDAYEVITSSKGRTIGMSGRSLNVILSGDSALVRS
jgi:hypothetical protein